MTRQPDQPDEAALRALARQAVEAHDADARHELASWALANPQAVLALLATLADLRARLAAAEGELRLVDNALARRPAMDQPTRSANIEHACATAQRETDRANRLERELAAVTASRDALRTDRDVALSACRVERRRADKAAAARAVAETERDEWREKWAQGTRVVDRYEAAMRAAETALAAVTAERDEAVGDYEDLRQNLLRVLRVSEDEALAAEDDDESLVFAVSGRLAAKDAAEQQRDTARAEVDMLRGVGCREAKEGEPESGPCGVCLRCLKEQRDTARAEAARLRFALSATAGRDPRDGSPCWCESDKYRDNHLHHGHCQIGRAALSAPEGRPDDDPGPECSICRRPGRHTHACE